MNRYIFSLALPRLEELQEVDTIAKRLEYVYSWNEKEALRLVTNALLGSRLLLYSLHCVVFGSEAELREVYSDSVYVDNWEAVIKFIEIIGKEAGEILGRVEGYQEEGEDTKAGEALEDGVLRLIELYESLYSLAIAE